MDTLMGIGATIVCQTSQGVDLHATPLRFTRFTAAFELQNPATVLRTSEVLSSFKIRVNEEVVYNGKAVVTNLINTGLGLVCEAILDDAWFVTPTPASDGQALDVQADYGRFIAEWQKLYRIEPAFKVLIADIQTYLTDLRLWLNQAEMRLRAAPTDDQPEMEREIIESLGRPIRGTLNGLFEQFEILAAALPPDVRPAHQRHLQRQLHPLVMVSPFARRTYTKPLGYAGDYEMVNMLLRSPYEGESLYAKLLNSWFISQPPAEAHRNRVQLLTQRLLGEAVRTASRQAPLRALNIGCGPAREIVEFMGGHEIANRARFSLVDFNEETLRYTNGELEMAKRRHSRATSFRLIKKSVVQLLKGASMNANQEQYDFIYCAGLYDYLPNRVCRQLSTVLFDFLAPGGLLLLTNVDSSNPIHHMLDFMLEWHLTYRSGAEFLAVGPEDTAGAEALVRADATGVNLFLEIRKPA